MALTAQPAGTVTINVADNIPSSDATVDTDADVSGDQSTLTFNTENYNTAKTVTVTPNPSGADNNGNSPRAVRFAVFGGDYDGIIRDHRVLMQAVTNPTAMTLSASSVTLSEGGNNATFTVALAGPSPNQAIDVDVASSDTGAVAVDTDLNTSGNQTRLRFQPADYTTAQTVYLKPIDDNDAVSESVTITAGVVWGSNYSGESASLTATVTDDELGLAASAITETTATLTITNHTAAWWYKGNQSDAVCTSVAANTSTASLAALDSGTDYTYKAYSDSACTTELTNADTDADFTTLGLAASAITQTTATLTIAGHTAAWWYKQTSPSTGTCTSVAANTSTASLTTLSEGTSYTYAAYSDNACTTLLATASSFTTLDLTASAITQTTATLTIANHTGNWYHKHTTPSDGTCSAAVSATTASLTSLDGATAYTYAAYSDSGCTALLATASAFTTLDLAASAITKTTATLTISGHTAAWWYKQTAPTGRDLHRRRGEHRDRELEHAQPRHGLHVQGL